MGKIHIKNLFIRFKRINVFLKTLVIPGMLFVFLFWGIINLGTNMEQKTIYVNKSSYITEQFIIKEVKEEYLILDVNLICPKGSFDAFTFSVAKNFKIHAERTAMYTRDYSTNVSVFGTMSLRAEDTYYLNNGYSYKDIKLTLPPNTATFPLTSSTVNMFTYIYKDNTIINPNMIIITNESNWLHINEVSNILSYNSNRSDDQRLINGIQNDFVSKGPFLNSFSLTIQYPLIYKLLVIFIFTSVILLILLTQIHIQIRKELDIGFIGILIAVLVGLPSINNLLKMNIVSSLSFIDIITMLLYVWIIIIIIISFYYKKSNYFKT